MVLTLMFSIFTSLFLIPDTNPDKEKIILQRIEYIINLKLVIDREVWKGFSHKKFDLPLVYYTDTACYIANPTEKFLASFKPQLMFKVGELKIYKTPLLDSVPFHMETGITLGSSSTLYNYKSPFMNCSSLEISRKTVPDINSTEQWTTMILHEYFHGFQFKHPEFLNNFEKNTAIAEDSLKSIYKANYWFKESVDRENRILLKALSMKDVKQIGGLVDSFFLLRDQRRLQTKQQLKVDITTVEQMYETMEGTARYAEYSLYSHFGKKAPDRKLTESDSSYHSYRYFRNFKIENDKWLYLSEKTTYFYATGFNIVRILDRLKIDYKTSLFNKGDLYLEQLLKQQMTTRGK